MGEEYQITNSIDDHAYGEVKEPLDPDYHAGSEWQFHTLILH